MFVHPARGPRERLCERRMRAFFFTNMTGACGKGGAAIGFQVYLCRQRDCVHDHINDAGGCGHGKTHIHRPRTARRHELGTRRANKSDLRPLGTGRNALFFVRQQARDHIDETSQVHRFGNEIAHAHDRESPTLVWSQLAAQHNHARGFASR